MSEAELVAKIVSCREEMDDAECGSTMLWDVEEDRILHLNPKSGGYDIRAGRGW